LVLDSSFPDADRRKGAGNPPLVIPEGCNPLAANWNCLLPYPSGGRIQNFCDGPCDPE